MAQGGGYACEAHCEGMQNEYTCTRIHANTAYEYAFKRHGTWG